MRREIGRLGLAAVVGIVVLTLTAPAWAEVKPAKLFSDNMVIQRDMETRMWGWAEPGEAVSVAVDGKEAAVGKAGTDGRWEVKLPSMVAGGPHEIVIKAPSGNAAIRNVLVGEVWLCSGQSNMQWATGWGNVFGAAGSEERANNVAAANDPQLRLLTVGKVIGAAPAQDVTGEWQAAAGENVLNWSAVAYYFGRELRAKLNVPVGLIVSAVGGTPVESWMDREAILGAAPDQAQTLQWWDTSVAQWETQGKPAWEKTLAAWEAEVAKAKAEGKAEPKKPRMPDGNPDNAWWPSSLYRGMIAPVVGYGMRGATWYQGESNAGKADLYEKLFPAMITSWRKAWGEGDFPFMWVQLANFQKEQTNPSEGGWAGLRDAQRKTLSLPNTAMASAIDIGEAGNIHPRNKMEVGRRLMLAALATAYGKKDVEWSGPLYAGIKATGGKAVIRFSHTTGGLAARGGGELKGFTVAGPDKVWHWAQAKVDGDDVVVWSDEVREPAAVRYSWASNPVGNLVNGEGLPASSFRTDDWGQ